MPSAPLPLSNTEDARTLPKGTVLLRALNAWTRIDAVYDAASDSAHHLHALGDAFSATALGVRQFPGLSSAQTALRNLTGDQSLMLNVGQQFATADTRIVTTPFTLAYGVTNRLTIGAMVPIVQTHSTLFVELNPQRLGNATGANVGPNPALLANSTAKQQNTDLINALQLALDNLHSFIGGCASSGSCTPDQLRAAKFSLQDSLALLAVQFLNTNAGPANAFAPSAAVKSDIETYLGKLRDSINTLLGTSHAFGDPAFAQAPAALFQLQQLATARPGVAFDSLGSPDRIGIGDVEVSAMFKLLDGFSDTTGGVRLRGTLRGVLRLGTGSPPDGTVPFEVGTGTGQTSADGAAVFDMRLGRRLMTTFVGQYTSYFTSSNVARLPNANYALFPLDVPVAGSWREGDALQLEAMPRIQLTDYFTFHGAYTFRHQAASRFTSPDVSTPPLFSATTEQRAGLGFAYSTVTRYTRGRSSVPFELFFTHLETLNASGGLTPKYNRDQIEFRIYYRLRRPGR